MVVTRSDLSRREPIIAGSQNDADHTSDTDWPNEAQNRHSSFVHDEVED